ncbi:UNVERIFIED_CONTAM: hypothetical protein FKN15_057503 [Acipenser sinensis]
MLQNYQYILLSHLLLSTRRLIGQKFVFQQDNDPKHSTKSTKEFLKKRKITVMDLSPQT